MPGRYWEEFEVGQVIPHTERHVVTQDENAAFCRMTLNNQPLHLDEEAARQGPFGRLLVNGLLTFALGVGISVEDLTAGTLVANLGYDAVRHPNPVFPGDELRVRTTILSKRRTSKPERGLVEVESEIQNQDGTVVCTFRRTLLVHVRRPEVASA